MTCHIFFLQFSFYVIRCDSSRKPIKTEAVFGLSMGLFIKVVSFSVQFVHFLIYCSFGRFVTKGNCTRFVYSIFIFGSKWYLHCRWNDSLNGTVRQKVFDVRPMTAPELLTIADDLLGY